MVLLGQILRVIVVLLFIRLLLRFVAGVIRGYREPARPDHPVPARDGSTRLVRDAVCNTYLPLDRALVALVKGREEHFCSPACRDRALQAAP